MIQYLLASPGKAAVVRVMRLAASRCTALLMALINELLPAFWAPTCHSRPSAQVALM